MAKQVTLYVYRLQCDSKNQYVFEAFQIPVKETLKQYQLLEDNEVGWKGQICPKSEVGGMSYMFNSFDSDCVILTENNVKLALEIFKENTIKQVTKNIDELKENPVSLRKQKYGKKLEIKLSVIDYELEKINE